MYWKCCCCSCSWSCRTISRRCCCCSCWICMCRHRLLLTNHSASNFSERSIYFFRKMSSQEEEAVTAAAASSSSKSYAKATILWSDDDAAASPPANLTSNRESTWIQCKQIQVPGISEYFFRCGNKDYYLNPQCEDGEKISDIAIKKKHGQVAISHVF